jgi:MFS family permease
MTERPGAEQAHQPARFKRVGPAGGGYGVEVPPVLSVLLRHRDFRRLFLAELAVFGGDWFVLIPLLVMLNELTGSGLWGALALAADTGIVALLLPYTGTVADRVDRKKIMVLANLGAIAMVLLLFAVRSAATAWVAVLAVSLFAVAKAFYTPAAAAALPNLVPPEDLSAANAIAGSAWGTMAVVGASIGGILSAAFSPYAAFVFTTVALTLAALLVWRIDRPMQSERTGAGAVRTWSAILEGLGYVGRRPRVLALVTVKSAVGLGNGVLTVFPLLAAASGVGPAGAGLLFAVRGLGVLVGPFLLRRFFRRRDWLLPGLSISMATYGLAYLGVSVVAWFPLVLVLVLLAHLGAGGNWTMSNYALQAEVPDALRGRVFATDIMLASVAISVSQLIVGALVETVNTHVLIAGCGMVTLAYAIGWRLATLRLVASPAGPIGDGLDTAR